MGMEIGMKIKERKLLYFWLMLVAAVCVGSIVPHGGLPKGPIRLGIPVRMILFFLLASIPLYDFHKLRNAMYAALSMAMLGILLEFMQRSVPGREYSAVDMVANNVGVLLGFAVGFVVRIKKESKRSTQDVP